MQIAKKQDWGYATDHSATEVSAHLSAGKRGRMGRPLKTFEWQDSDVWNNDLDDLFAELDEKNQDLTPGSVKISTPNGFWVSTFSTSRFLCP